MNEIKLMTFQGIQFQANNQNIPRRAEKVLRFSLLEKSPSGKVKFTIQKQNIVNMLSLMAF